MAGIVDTTLTNDQTVQGYEQQAEALDVAREDLRGMQKGTLKDLFNYDKALSERYSSPDSKMYIENAADRERAISGYSDIARGEVSNLYDIMQGVSKARQDLLERVEMLKEQAKKASAGGGGGMTALSILQSIQRPTQTKALELAPDDIVKKAQETGGRVWVATDEKTGEKTYNIRKPYEPVQPNEAPYIPPEEIQKEEKQIEQQQEEMITDMFGLTTEQLQTLSFMEMQGGEMAQQAAKIISQSMVDNTAPVTTITPELAKAGVQYGDSKRTAAKKVEKYYTTGEGSQTDQQKNTREQMKQLQKNIDTAQWLYDQMETKGWQAVIPTQIAKKTQGLGYQGIWGYESLREAFLTQIARNIGMEKGTISEGDVIRIAGWLPKPTENPTIAKQKFEIISMLMEEGNFDPTRLNELEGELKKVEKGIQEPLNKQLGKTSAVYASEKEEKEYKAEGMQFDNNAIKFLAESDFLPMALSIPASILGFAGAGPFGSVPMAALGGAAGKSMQKGLQELMDPKKNTLTSAAREVMQEGLTQAIFEGVGLGIMKVGGKIVAGMMKPVARGLDTAKTGLIKRALGTTPRDLAEYRMSTGGQELVEDFVKKGIPKSVEEAVETATKQGDEAFEAVNKTVSGKQFATSGIVKKLETFKATLKNSPAVRSAINQIDEYIDYIKSYGNTIDGSDLNKIKRELQGLGDAAFSPVGTATPASTALANASRIIKKTIEEVVPEVKNINKDIIYNKLIAELGQKVIDKQKSVVLTGIDAILAGSGTVVTGSPIAGAQMVVIKRMIQKLTSDPLKQAKIIGQIIKYGQNIGDKGLVKTGIQILTGLGVRFTGEIIEDEVERK